MGCWWGSGCPLLCWGGGLGLGVRADAAGEGRAVPGCWGPARHSWERGLDSAPPQEWGKTLFSSAGVGQQQELPVLLCPHGGSEVTWGTDRDVMTYVLEGRQRASQVLGTFGDR